MNTLKKIIFSIMMVFLSNSIFAQKLITKTGQVKFLASNATALEEVSAVNSTNSAILELSTGNVAIQSIIKAFKFKVPLMEEHFNENYLESDKFPKSTFAGKILNFDASKLTSAKTNYTVEGDFTLHGVTKHLKFPVSIFKNGNKIEVSSTLNIKAQDYKIKIPSLVKQKVADDIKVWVNLEFTS